MPSIVNTSVGDTLESIVREFYLVNDDFISDAIEHVEKLNKIPLNDTLAPNKSLILPDAAVVGTCTVEYGALGLVPEISYRNNDPLNRILDTGMGDKVLSAMEIIEWLDANSVSKAAFGGCNECDL